MKFTKTHDWAKIEGNVATIGISEYAQKELGDIVYVQLPKLGHQIEAEDEVAVLESTKAAVDIYAPLSGKIVEINVLLLQKPQIINESAESAGWLYRLELSDLQQVQNLMDDSSYRALISS